MTITKLIPTVKKLSTTDKRLLIKVVQEMVETEDAPNQRLETNESQPTESNLTEEEEDALELAEQVAFLQKPLEERRRIMAKQAEKMTAHYEQNTEWKEWLAGDIVEY